jgi:hypothetical protein
MLEKEFFTKRRSDQLSVWPRHKEIEMWGKYCYVPLNIPRIENTNLVEWFNLQKKKIYKNVVDVASTNTNISNYEAVDVLPSGTLEYHKSISSWDLNVKNEFLVLFSDFYQEILHHFPFKSLSRIRMWSSTTDIPYHRDQARFTDNPSTFRLMLHDENPNQTLSIAECLPDAELNTNNIFTLPELKNTNSFVWNNLRIKHGSTYNSNHRKILILFEGYELDVDRYNELMKRSIDKYKNELLVSDNFIGDYINL